MKYGWEYLAGILEGRAYITKEPLSVVLRMDGPIPKFLHKRFGGTFCKHMGKPFFRVRGNSAVRLLEAFSPYLVLRKRRVRRYLKRWVRKSRIGAGG